jgi:glutathione-independent formaldehyde dehydrogenase
MGGWQGGQAEYVLVPYADFECLVLPKEQAKDRLLELTMLSDILPTGFNGAVQAGVTVGRTVYVAGAGPVGICAAASAVLLGAAVVVVGDINADRLPNAAKLGPVVKTLDLGKIGSKPEDLSKALLALIGEKEVDCAIDAVGFEAGGHGGNTGKEDSTIVLNACFNAVAAGGGVGIPGLYPPEDPQGKDEQHKKGLLPLAFGKAWSKALKLEMGQCPVMKFNRELMLSILHNRIAVADALNVTVIKLEDAPEAYKKFNAGAAIKYVFDPHGYTK